MYGNFQTGDYDAALARLDNTKTINERDPFIPEGDHILMLLTLEPFNHQQHGPSARASFEVMATNNPQLTVGTRVTKLWNLTRPSKFPNQANDGDRFADFVRNLVGAQQGTQVGQQCRALLRERVQEQLGRGMLIKARGVNTSKKADKPWVEVYWTHHAQTQDEIKARRPGIEAKLSAAPVQAPQPQQLQYMQNPPQVQPQYQQPQYGQPVAAPVMMPAPQQAPWPPQVQAPSPAPQQGGGLLSQVPGGTPTGGNNGQGNGGGLIPF